MQGDIAIAYLTRQFHHLMKALVNLLHGAARKELLKDSEALLKAADGHAQIVNRIGMVDPGGAMDAKCHPAQQHRSSLQRVLSHYDRNLLRTISRP
jgi:hypothetical protein